MDWPYQGLADALARTPGELRSAWLSAYRRSSLRLPRPVDDEELARWFEPLIESLTEALAPAPRPDGRQGAAARRLEPGAAEVREVEKAAAFLGGRLAAEAVTGFDIAAVFTALRDVSLPLCGEAARPEVQAFVEWLVVLAVDAMASAREQALRERNREELERGTPVVLVAPDVVAIFAVGRPDAMALDTVVSRALLRVARVGAKAIVIDLSGVSDDGDRPLVDAISRLLEHRKIAGQIPVWLAGPGAEPGSVWAEVGAEHPQTLRLAPTFEQALEGAMERSDYRLLRRGSGH